MSTSPPTSITTCPGAGLRWPRVIWSSTSPPRLTEGGSAGRVSRVPDIEAHGGGPVAALPLQTLVLVLRRADVRRESARCVRRWPGARAAGRRPVGWYRGPGGLH